MPCRDTQSPGPEALSVRRSCTQKTQVSAAAAQGALPTPRPWPGPRRGEVHSTAEKWQTEMDITLMSRPPVVICSYYSVVISLENAAIR